MADFRISLAGDLGSGKSTVTEIIKQKINVEVISLGKLFREVAEEMGMTPVEFNIFMQTHPEYDNKFDDKQKAYDKIPGNFIFDSRMSFHFIPSAFSYYLKVDIRESARRIMSADRSDEKYTSIEDAVEKIQKRRESEILRYKKLYNVDITDMSNYDCVIDTTNMTAEQVANKIIENYKIK